MFLNRLAVIINYSTNVAELKSDDQIYIEIDFSYSINKTRKVSQYI